uniref:CDT1 domain-containing protein n=1 Tax=Macrostomum lignano TaxID=282301 RepID=A0A1I8HEQ5_9PLAT
MGTLVSLSRPAQKSGGRAATRRGVFASLYAVFARHHASVLGDDIRQMLISMINANLAFCRASVGLSGQRHSGLSRLGFALSATSIEDSNLWLCGHRILDCFELIGIDCKTDAGLLANLCGVLAHWAGPGDFDLYVDIDASIVFESSTAVGVDSAAQKNFVITDQSGAMSHRTRTSLAVAAPTASQAMPEMRLLAEPPVELNLLTEQSGLDCELTNSDAETVLIVCPLILTPADLSDSTPAGLEAASEDDLAGEASRIATVDSVHLPRLRLPTPSDQSASESLVEVNIGLRVALSSAAAVSSGHPSRLHIRDRVPPADCSAELDPAGLSRSTPPVA